MKKKSIWPTCEIPVVPSQLSVWETMQSVMFKALHVVDFKEWIIFYFISLCTIIIIIIFFIFVNMVQDNPFQWMLQTS